MELFVVQQPIDDVFDVLFLGVADTSVHVDFRHILEGHPGTLQDIQDFSHVAFAQFDQRLFTILRNFDAGINEIL